MSDRVREILSWYARTTRARSANLYRMLMTGRLAGTGKLVILPVDQGFEHGPARSFAPNPAGLRPALPLPARHRRRLQRLRRAARLHRGRRGRVRRADPAHPQAQQLRQPVQRQRPLPGGHRPASTTPCGSAARPSASPSIRARPSATTMYEELRELALEAKAAGLAVVVWSYPRGSGLSKDGETAIDVSAYAAQIAAQLGAHIIKVKPPSDHIEQDAARKVYEKHGIPVGDAGRPRAPRRAGRVRRPPHRHLLRRRDGDHRGRPRGQPPDRRGRRLRHHHGPQLLPARARRGRQAAAGRDGHLRRGRRSKAPAQATVRTAGAAGIAGRPGRVRTAEGCSARRLQARDEHLDQLRVELRAGAARATPPSASSCDSAVR